MDDDDGEIREILSDFILGQIISHLISSHLSLSVFSFFFPDSLLVFFCGVRQENWEKKPSIDMSKE